MNKNLSQEQWKAIAEKLAEYLDDFCDMLPASECANCPLYDCSGALGAIKMHAIKKAKKELGYE